MKRAQTKVLLDELQNASELVLRVHDRARASPRGDYDGSNAKAQTGVVGLRRRDGIVPAAPVIPEQDDGGRVPVLALAHRVEDRTDPARSAAAAAGRMIRV